MGRYINTSFSDRRIVQEDELSGAIKTIQYAHHEIHEGNAFLVVYSALADDTDAVEIRIETPAGDKRAHMLISIDSALACTVELWMNTTKTDVVGNRLTAMNRDHDSVKQSILTICHTPAGAQAGSADLQQYIGSASVSGKTDTGGGTGSRAEFLLAAGSAYLIKATSRADNNALSIVLDWYEHESEE